MVAAMSARSEQAKLHDQPLMTPDGRDIVVRGRLWRATNPDFKAEVRAWWQDGAPDLNRRMAQTTPYADGYQSVSPAKQR